MVEGDTPRRLRHFKPCDKALAPSQNPKHATSSDSAGVGLPARVSTMTYCITISTESKFFFFVVVVFGIVHALKRSIRASFYSPEKVVHNLKLVRGIHFPSAEGRGLSIPDWLVISRDPEFHLHGDQISGKVGPSFYGNGMNCQAHLTCKKTTKNIPQAVILNNYIFFLYVHIMWTRTSQLEYTPRSYKSQKTCKVPANISSTGRYFLCIISFFTNEVTNLYISNDSLKMRNTSYRK